jgi:hypothetical protein
MVSRDTKRTFDHCDKKVILLCVGGMIMIVTNNGCLTVSNTG